MKQQILLVDSSQERPEFLVKLIIRLSQEGFWFWLWSTKNYLYQQFQANSWPARLSKRGWPRSAWSFYLLLPWSRLSNLLRLFSYQRWHQVSTIICCAWPEKIALTPLAHWLGLRVIWWEAPNFNLADLPNFWQKRYQRAGRLADIVCASSFQRQQLIDQSLPEKNCRVILPGISLDDYLYQKNIFDNLAGLKRRPAFTLGAIVDLDQEHRVKTLLQILAACLSLSYDLQLVIMAHGQQRQQISWLIKKMRLDGRVWLVSDQVSLKKWFSTFDLFVVASCRPNINDISITLGAMANGLVTLGHIDSGLGDLSFNNQAVLLLDLDQVEAAASQIIELQQNPVQRKLLAVNAKAAVNKYFLFDRLIKDWQDLLKID